MKIFIDIDNKKVQSDNKSEPNYYMLFFKDIEIKDEFQEFNYKIVNNIEVKLNIKVKNKFNSAKVDNLFKKFNQGQNKKEEVLQPKSVIGTGVNMKERLAMFSNNKKDNTTKSTTSNNTTQKKLNENKKDNIKEENIKKENENKEKKENKEIKENKENVNKTDNKELKKEVKKEEIKENKKEVKNEAKKEEIKETKKEEIKETKKEDKKEDKNEVKKEAKKEDKTEVKKDTKKEDKNEIKKEVKTEDKKEEKEEIKKEDNKEVKKEDKSEIRKEVKTEDKKEDNKEVKKEEKKESKKEENKEVKKEKEKDKAELIVENNKKEELKEVKEEIYINKEDNPDEEVSNININMEMNKIKSKEEEIEVKNPIGTEKEKISKNFEKRASNASKFINPLTKNDNELEENEKGRTRPRVFAYANLPKTRTIQNAKKENKPEENNSSNINNRNISVNIEKLDKNMKKKMEENAGLTSSTNSIEKEDTNDDCSLRSISTEYSSTRSLAPDVVLDSITYEKYLEQLKSRGKKEYESDRESFCEAFFLASFPYKNGQVIENSNTFPAMCNHGDCGRFNAMKPEIIIRYPLEDTKNLELNNLAATICFPTGIKVCYSESEPPKGIKDYITNITNQKGERLYMMNYHFYIKMSFEEYQKKYELNSLKHNLRKFGDAYLTYSEEEFTQNLVEEVQKKLEFCQNIAFREYVYIPYCLCLISKYPYQFEMEKCLQSIFKVMSEKETKFNFEINDLIMYLIHSIPAPDKNSLVKFYLPYWDKEISLKCEKINRLDTVNMDLVELIRYFSENNIIIIFRLLLSEKKILFIDDDYTLLSKVTEAFMSILFPIKWIHTYIPIMSDQMIKYLESFLPFLNGIHTSLMPLVKKTFNEGEIDESEEVFLIYIKEDNIQLGSSLTDKKIKLNKYLQDPKNNVISLPSSVDKYLRDKLTTIKEKYEINQKNIKKKTIFDLNKLFRKAFIKVFIYFLHDYKKYIVMMDDDEVIFNKNLFMKAAKKEEKAFFEQFLETQLFEQFTQNIFSRECKYFDKEIASHVIKEKNKERSSISTNLFNIEKNYIVKPDFLKLEEDKLNISIEKALSEKYKIDLKKDSENGIILPSERIITDIKEVSNDKYDNEKCFIYLLPEKKESSQNNKQEQEQEQEIEQEPEDDRAKFMKQLSNNIANFGSGRKRKQTFINANMKVENINEKKKDLIKEEIKDWVIKIFKSEIEDYKNNPKIKTDVLSLINNPFGIKYFVDLISHSTQSVTLLQTSSFKLLLFIIYNALLFLLNREETDQVLEECVLLIKSAYNFYEERSGQNRSLIENPEFKKNISKYNKINQKNFWKKWFEIELTEKKNIKKKQNEENDDTELDEDDFSKQKILLNICMKMIEFEIPKTTIKNICDEINKKIFENNTELAEQTKATYINYITSAKFVSKIVI